MHPNPACTRDPLHSAAGSLPGKCSHWHVLRHPLCRRGMSVAKFRLHSGEGSIIVDACLQATQVSAYRGYLSGLEGTHASQLRIRSARAV